MAAAAASDSRERTERRRRCQCRGAGLLFVSLVLLAVPRGVRSSEVSSDTSVTSVTSTDWSQVLRGHSMILFYAPWCPACQQIQSAWESFGEKSEALGVKVVKVDVTQEPGLSGRFFVTTLPTIFHAKDGVFRRYHGSRMVEDLQTFISEKKWEVIEPVAGWRSPSSIVMSGMASLFQLSGWMRQLHNYFTGPLEIPSWGSYIIFIVATLLVGLLLGLMLVLIIDCCCPSKSKYEVMREEVNEENLANLEAEAKVVPVERKPDCAANEGGSDDENEEEEDEEESGNSSEGDNEKENSNEDDSEDSDEEEDDDDDEEEGEASNAQNVAKDSDEDSAVAGSEAEEDNVPEVSPAESESESALRQRRVEATEGSGH
ncbi:thioredoxin-related transmembrane protein 4 L homeolog [Xenopus laevis]|uniref:Thioredoxin-related transmembrane protein 4 L homeolog n=1 Tax=Xenopus laevis TaxID=8355 RepID=A4IFX1_XENLA|nr:thioredoxin-related transmembrane protein 4 L homeolog [Xenopus laevis]AAI34819.1 Unknown (protein for MGC:161007) [Xenopus laevis]